MSDQGFNFNPAPERREAKRFEPPPWERDAFDELAKRKAAEDEAARAAEEEGASEAPTEGQNAPTAAAQPEAVTAPPAEQPAAGPEALTARPVEIEPEQPAQAAGPASGEIDQAQLLEMMAGLRAEEPSVNEAVHSIGLFWAVAIGLVGLMTLTWSGFAFVRAAQATSGKQLGLVGGMILAVFGLLFIGMAIWIVQRILRQRGVI